MAKYVESVKMILEHCCSCGMPFGMTADYQRIRLSDHKSFYCPMGHTQYYTAKSNEETLESRLEAAEKDKTAVMNKLNQAQRQLEAEEVKSKTVSDKYNRMKKRVINGVCPCCNRSFDNLAKHMATKHSDFGNASKLKVLRNVFGLSQSNLADDIGVNTAHVSAFENDRPMIAHAREALEFWISTQAG